MKYLDILVDRCFFTVVIILKIVIKSNPIFDNIYGHNLIAPFFVTKIHNTVYFVSN